MGPLPIAKAQGGYPGRSGHGMEVATASAALEKGDQTALKPTNLKLMDAPGSRERQEAITKAEARSVGLRKSWQQLLLERCHAGALRVP